MKSKMLKEAFFLMVITTIMVSFPFSVSADEDLYHKCVDECYSTCFADIAGCYEYCLQECKHPDFHASKRLKCSDVNCAKFKGDKRFHCLITCSKMEDKFKGGKVLGAEKHQNKIH
ncbi:uncharacterized protein LOC132618175 [Lycium barbarum]|uniref:uncharacterized protein LOC132618175 n=1 Tax=Lycium barbarum TaxID=112863 RepID=UPI00293ED52E|nr:uncharacterized protein LOC132618175 [Lycium barbarum]